ncbi:MULTISPECIES: sensor histidine kinase KdpD [unclassified Janthinobacterium]|uniref:sensor histidine kinase n=1 Tax=unclassified Janthinobacterium TaxID=2610881 RepID=UPI001609055F|nr:MULTISPECIES: HAMP domain-containing sensor histidine kinase [unclassified Janthinobacterium]MBB5606465.1 signal transduction histidine kinase [Janthinobacterium sp. S3T4]MBB5611663.1 signal transduction histidine kinase [Janthinobacterium sp. S3M3]
MNIATSHHHVQRRQPARGQRLLALREAVLTDWEHRVRASVQGADQLLTPILINTLPAFFDNLAEALTPGYPRQNAASNSNVPAVHGNERARMTNYGPEQVIQEYQIFRDCFADAAREAGIALRRNDWRIINASIDTGIRESIREFTAMHEGFQRRIAAGLSHDMRNPLSVIITAAQMLQRFPERANVSGLGQKILEHGHRLDTMIEELLDTLSYQQGQRLPLALSQFDILPLVQAICAQVNELVSLPHGDKCRVSGVSVTGWWCENSVRRALENLLNNAVKYGDDDPITVHVEATHGRMIITVHNTGSPITPDKTPRIFEYLRRENHGPTPGWGIGLPYVQNVAESHGGSVAVDSAPETGTTFIFDIPVDCRPFVTPPP